MKKICIAFILLLLIFMLTGCACKHDETALVNVQEAACEIAGYTGDTQCTKCNKILSAGQTIPATGHEPGSLIDVQAADCTHDGYTGNRLCIVCSKQVETGMVIEKTSHIASQPKGVKEPSCTEEGYSGDISCVHCGEMLQQGERIAMLSHTPGEPEKVQEPTCVTTGFSGNIYCTACGLLLEKGLSIPRLDHEYSAPAGNTEATCSAEGYTGDLSCIHCNFIQQGEVLPRLKHNYDQHVCTACGWPEAGLYDSQGKMMYTWQQMVDQKLITISKQSMDGLNAAFVSAKDKTAIAGTLVISDQINTRFNTNVYVSWNGFAGCENLTEVYLPPHLTKVTNRAFDNSGVEKVHFGGEITTIDVAAFNSCDHLKRFDIPEGTKEIYANAFAGCTALEHVTLPSTIKHIGQGSFKNDTLITEIVFPEGLEGLSSGSFQNTGLREVVLPSTVTTLDYTGTGNAGPFANCKQLTKIDLSKTQITRLHGTQFTDCSALESLLLPYGLKEMSAVSLNGTNLTELYLPKGFSTLFLGYYDKVTCDITTIYWPLSFIDKDQVFANHHFDRVYYEGTEAQWSMFAPEGVDITEIVFNYVYE